MPNLIPPFQNEVRNFGYAFQIVLLWVTSGITIASLREYVSTRKITSLILVIVGVVLLVTVIWLR